jgi:hypothetical protein
MEISGLVLGIAGLAGLFTACVDCFALIQSGRTHGRDYEILLTKLDVEKTRLLQWGDGVGLLSSDPQSRNRFLELDHTRPTIERVLHCIAMLLTDADRLRSKYGMCDDNQRDGPNDVSTGMTVVSAPRLHIFRAAYTRFQNRIALQQKSTSNLAKAKWVIRDREGFGDLIRDLQDFIDSLYKVVPVPPQFTRLLVMEDIDRLPADLGTLRLVEEACADREDEWSDAASTRRQNTEIASEDARSILEWNQNVQMNVRQSEEDSTSQGDIFDRAGGASEVFLSGIGQTVVSNSHSTSPGSFREQDRPAGSALFDPRRQSRGLQTSIHNLSPRDYLFEQHLVLNGVFPNSRLTTPNNIEEIYQEMAQWQLPLLSVQEFHDFKLMYKHNANEDTMMQFMIGALSQGESRANFSSRNVRFNSLKPLTDGTLPPAFPDLCFGASPEQLETKILEELSEYILPSKQRYCPIVPNCFLEIASSRISTAEIRRQACYYGALGARGIIRLQSYGESEPVFDGNAYTFVVTFQDGTLKIYAIWPKRSISSPPSRDNDRWTQMEFRMAMVETWVLTASLERYREGMVALWNARRLTEKWRNSFIDAANARVH